MLHRHHSSLCCAFSVPPPALSPFPLTFPNSVVWHEFPSYVPIHQTAHCCPFTSLPPLYLTAEVTQGNAAYPRLPCWTSPTTPLKTGMGLEEFSSGALGTFQRSKKSAAQVQSQNFFQAAVRAAQFNSLPASPWRVSPWQHTAQLLPAAKPQPQNYLQKLLNH